jgi:hypothetical protein
MQDGDLASLPIEILALIHSCVLRADRTLRSCLALEATCKHLRGLLHSNTRFETVFVNAESQAPTQGSSFWSWIAAHGRRTDSLLLEHLELRHSTPTLCSNAGVLQAGAVVVSAAVVDTLEPLRGLLNLIAVDYEGPNSDDDAADDVSLEPLAGLAALEHLHLSNVVGGTTTLAPLRSMSALTDLTIHNYAVPRLDDLSSLSKLRALHLLGFGDVTSVAPLSCLTSLTHVVLVGFASLDDVQPLHALSTLQQLTLGIRSPGPISLEPLRKLSSLVTLVLKGFGHHNMTDYDLQPLSALSSTLKVLVLHQCVLQNVLSIRSLGPTLRGLTLMECEYQPGFQLAPLFTPLACLYSLSMSGTTAADLDAIGQRLTGLVKLNLAHTEAVTSLAALAPLTRLRSLSLQSCTHVSSIEPLTTLTQLQSLCMLSCLQLTDPSPLTALQSLRQLRLEGCPQLAASLPTSLHPLLLAPGQGV